MNMLLLAFLLACGSPPEPPTFPSTDVATLASLPGPTVIDVRTEAEFADGHVPGARNVPLDRLDPATLGVDKGETVHVICQSGRRSAVAAEKLAAAGYSVVNVEGGTSAWIAAGKPVER